jgi:uncharacterized protein DUF5655
MSADEREEERRFLAELKARSGRTLVEWMAAISAQGFADKNDAIDWLRAQGFPFARASWLERIHTNGGKPIYADEPPRPVPAPQPERLRPKARVLTSNETAQLDKLLAAAKGYRPLYQLLESEIRRTLPGVTIEPRPGYISIGCPREFAAITLHASEIRLGLDLGDRAFDAQLQRAKLKGPGQAISHMLVLTDARQANADLLAQLIAANARVNG